MATEFVCAIAADDSEDYQTLDLWEDAVGCDLRAATNTARVYPIASNNSLAVGDSITGAGTGNYTGTVFGITSTQLLVVHGTAGQEYEDNEQINDDGSAAYCTLAATAAADVDTVIAVAEIHDELTLTATFSLTDFTTDATNYVIIRPVSGDEATLTKFDETKAFVTVNSTDDNNYGIQTTDTYTRINNLQVKQVGTDGSHQNRGVDFLGTGGSVTGCRFRDTVTTGAAVTAVRAPGVATITNSMFETGSGGSTNIAITCSSSSANKIYNCTLIGNDTSEVGIDTFSGGTDVICNCIIVAYVDTIDMTGSPDVDNCLSNESGFSDGDNSVYFNGDWSTVFVSTITRDFHLLPSDTVAHKAGLGNASDADIPLTDMEGTPRTTALVTDIGADEVADNLGGSAYITIMIGLD